MAFLTKTGKKVTSRICVDAVKRAFKDWLLGASLRDLEAKYGFKRCTFSYQFKKHYGENYVDLKKLNGVMNVLKEYSKNRQLTVKQRNLVLEFIELNREFIFEVDLANRHDPIYTERQIEVLSRVQINFTSCDFRDICDRSKVKSGDIYAAY